MNIQFQKLNICNFLSFGRAEIDLRDKGYCLVSGCNNNPLDKASSNGSGKSSWSSAICYALTGETIQGLSRNIKNINVPEKECWVELTFKIDKDVYKITRYNEPKSDLKIILNDKDISGKGIKESEAILKQYLPDLTSSLIASIIILGQGLPNKFSSNKPSGRKEVLEKLSKSDYMIDDLKKRLDARSNFLNESLRNVEDVILSKKTNKEVEENHILNLNQRLENLNKTRDFKSEIENVDKSIKQEETRVKSLENNINDKNNELNKLQDNLQSIEKLKNSALKEENNNYNEYYKGYLKESTELSSNIYNLNNTIKRLKSITDICPTCGQKIPNKEKPSTEKEEQMLGVLEAQKQKLTESFNINKTKHNDYSKSVETKYEPDLNKINKEIVKVKNELINLQSQKNSNLNVFYMQKARLEAEYKSYEDNLKQVKDDLEVAKNTVKKLQDEILYNNNEKEKLNSRLSVISKLTSLVRRDFRGFLLSNVISFIDRKAKEYSTELFGTEDLNFKLDGNDINITYCNKPFENLSGGEKQKVDIIIQFAIRDMMSQYLNFSSNILILDEIFDNLDPTCCENVINLISGKLTDIESIFIISHHSDELRIPADCNMLVTKNEQGISSISFN